jgi:eukaryotic-like serine/threonine-protein kinase
MLYHLLTGKSPVLIEASALAQGLVHIVQRATCGTPEDRYQNLGEFLDALRYYQLSKDPHKNAREALENLVLQAEDLLQRREYKAENIRAILGLLLPAGRPERGAAIASFDRIPHDLLPVMAREFAGEFLPLLKVYAEAIAARVASFNFAYADAVARRMRVVFAATRHRAVQTVALQATLIAAVALNRFAAMDVFNSLLRSVQTVDLALPIAEMLRAHAGPYQQVADQVPPDRLHPAIRAVQKDVLAGIAETSFSELG